MAVLDHLLFLVQENLCKTHHWCSPDHSSAQGRAPSHDITLTWQANVSAKMSYTSMIHGKGLLTHLSLWCSVLRIKTRLIFLSRWEQWICMIVISSRFYLHQDCWKDHKNAVASDPWHVSLTQWYIFWALSKCHLQMTDLLHYVHFLKDGRLISELLLLRVLLRPQYSICSHITAGNLTIRRTSKWRAH